jgi:hypothetical protein
MVKREETGLMLAQLTVKLLCLENGGWDSFIRKKEYEREVNSKELKGKFTTLNNVLYA